jgi:hypothetical protein
VLAFVGQLNRENPPGRPRGSDRGQQAADLKA